MTTTSQVTRIDFQIGQFDDEEDVLEMMILMIAKLFLMMKKMIS